MFVVVITEADGSLNIVGPFWHDNAAVEFAANLPDGISAEFYAVTDRDKWDDETSR